VRVVFLGTPPAAVPTLAALLEAGHAVPLVQPSRLRDEHLREELRATEPDALVVVAYGRILPASLLHLGPLGAINLHFSLLPRYRGAAPVAWALARGETLTGVTTMVMNDQLDAGDLLLQRELPIEPGEHAPALEARLAALGAALLVETLTRLASGAVSPRPQRQELATWAPPLRVADGSVDFDRPASEIEGRVRGFDPWPGTWVRRGGRRMRLVRARTEPGLAEGAVPGLVLRLPDSGLGVVCGGGTVLRLLEIQLEGRRSVPAEAACHGRQIQPGDRLDPGEGASAP
jgi:methionyl-tRNA formyltransferase